MFIFLLWKKSRNVKKIRLFSVVGYINEYVFIYVVRKIVFEIISCVRANF